MNSKMLRYLFLLLVATNGIVYCTTSNETDSVWMTEKGEEQDLMSRPLPPLAMKLKPPITGTDEPEVETPVEEVSEKMAEPEDVGCKPDLQPSHSQNDPGTAMGKCAIPNSLWAKTCQATMAVNKHYENVASKVDPEEKARAVEAQQIPMRHTSCRGHDDRSLITECKACTIQLKPNTFGVQLTCYECQKGHDDKTCHHTIKGPKKRQLLIILLMEEDQQLEAAAQEPDVTDAAEASDDTKCSIEPRVMRLTP